MMTFNHWKFFCTAILLLGTSHLSTAKHGFSARESHQFQERSLPQFVGFANAQGRQTRITQAFKDMETMVNRCLSGTRQTQATFSRVYANWFPPNNEQVVRDVLGNMVNPSSNDGTGSTTLAQIQLNNNDPNNICSIFNTVAYTLNAAPADNLNEAVPLTIHFCSTNAIDAYMLPDLSALSCATIGNTLSTAMQTLGGYALVHELSHVNPVAQAVIQPLGIAVPGQPNSICHAAEDFVYGPQSCQTLAANGQTALANADNYGWFVTELYWSLVCNRNFQPPTSNDLVPANVCTGNCIIR